MTDGCQHFKMNADSTSRKKHKLYVSSKNICIKNKGRLLKVFVHWILQCFEHNRVQRNQPNIFSYQGTKAQGSLKELAVIIMN